MWRTPASRRSGLNTSGGSPPSRGTRRSSSARASACIAAICARVRPATSQPAQREQNVGPPPGARAGSGTASRPSRPASRSRSAGCVGSSHPGSSARLLAGAHDARPASGQAGRAFRTAARGRDRRRAPGCARRGPAATIAPASSPCTSTTPPGRTSAASDASARCCPARPGSSEIVLPRQSAASKAPGRNGGASRSPATAARRRGSAATARSNPVASTRGRAAGEVKPRAAAGVRDPPPSHAAISACQNGRSRPARSAVGRAAPVAAQRSAFAAAHGRPGARRQGGVSGAAMPPTCV